MSRRSPAPRGLVRAFFAMGFAVLLIVATAFTAGAVPVAVLEDFQDLPTQPGAVLDSEDPPPFNNIEAPIGEGTVSIPFDNVVPDAEMEIEAPDVNTLSMPLAEGMDPMYAPDFSVTHLKWEVKQNGVHIGGATIDVRGPRQAQSGHWGYSASVKDCVSTVNNCSDTTDKDSRPGYFVVTQIVAGISTSNIEHGKSYAIRPDPLGTPAGTIWVSTDVWVDIPSSGNTVSQATWPRNTPGYQFPDLVIGDSPNLKWRVTNAGALVGGATVTLEGSSSGQTAWTNAVQVQDCITAPCASSSMDQDSTPGAFKVSTLRWGSAEGFKTEPVSRSNRYRVKPYDSPVGFAWADVNLTKEMASASVWGTPTSYDFGAFDLTPATLLSWTVSDATNALVGGATVQIRTQNTDNTWADYYVTDCTVDICHPESMDQDPAPGSFKIDTLRGLTADGLTQTVEDVFTDGRYSLLPMGSIPGFKWKISAMEVLVSSTEPAPDLKVVPRASRSEVCEAPNAYFTLNRGGTTTGALIQQATYSHDERNINSTLTKIGSPYSLMGTRQASDALGVTPTGIFYFTGQYGSNIQSDAEVALARNTTIYRYDPSDGQPYPVFNMDLLSPTTGTVVGGDATIYEGREEFYFAYFSNAPANSTLGEAGVRFHLYRYSHGNGKRTGEVTHIDVPRPANLTQFNGDFAFDAQNNIQFIISQADARVVSGSVNSADFQAKSSAHLLSDVHTVTGASNFDELNGSAINGVVYTRSGRGIIQQGASNRVVEMPNLDFRGDEKTFTGTYVDLASCATPATITIQKEVIGERYDPDDQFALGASRQEGMTTQEFTSVITTGAQSGIQGKQIGPFAISLAGTFTAREEFINAEATNYRTSWACYALDSQGELGEPFAKGDAASLTLDLSSEFYPQIQPGADLLCRFTNETLRDSLQIEKTSDPQSDYQLEPDAPVHYTLNFDNSAGTVAAAVDHVDHLSDVVDDADFIGGESEVMGSPVFTNTGDLATTWIADTSQISITGSIPPGSNASVSYSVKVKPNQTNAAERSDHSTSTNGYVLRNHLTETGATELSNPCTQNGYMSSTCTEHFVSAWTVYKDARPVDGARLHKGGNVHYRLVAEKMTPDTLLEGLVFTDDLTDVFKTAGFAPDAVVPGGALPRGIYFFDEFGQTLEAVDSSTHRADVVGGSGSPVSAIGADQIPVPVQKDGRWILKSQRIAVPQNAVRAELWFAVQVGEPMEIPGSWPKNGSGMELTPMMGDKFTNFLTASADIPPAQCRVETNVDDSDFPDACQITHELQENYFTIRKDAMGLGVDEVNLIPGVEPPTVSDDSYGSDTSGMWNMIGHEFEVRDNASGAPSDYQSLAMCRKDYNPYNGWKGEFTVPSPGAVLDIEEDSQTLAHIKQWNNENPEEDPLPLCGLLYEQGDIEDLNNPSNRGGQTGRWRSENLPAGEYWLVETKAPTHQISTNGQKKRPVPGVQLLAEPIPFRVWPDEANPDTSKAPANHGLGQLDVSYAGTFSDSDWLERCQPGNTVAERPTACVNPTGYLLLVKDVTTITLPFSGGRLLAAFTTAGSILLVLAGIGIFWWRRRE